MCVRVRVCVQVYVAAFSISGYAWASWRNRYKPFNPVLGETYENHREDRGFRYISEQVRRGETQRKHVSRTEAFVNKMSCCFIFRSAIIHPSLPVTPTQKTSLSGKVGGAEGSL